VKETKVGRNDPCPCGSGKKYKKCCLAETAAQVGTEEAIRKPLIDNLLEFYKIDTCQDLTEAIKANKDQLPKNPESDIPMETQRIERKRRTTAELTSTAGKIMELFRYFRLKKGEYLSLKLIQSKQHLWKNIEDEEFNEAVDDLIQLGYIERIEDPAGWKLLEAGEDNLKQLTLHF
jgi:hypothetical protein